MTPTRRPEADERAGERIGVPMGRLSWARDGDDLVTGRYRIRLLGPRLWETTYRGRHLRVDARRSMALAAAEHHHREMERRRLIIRWGALAGEALLGGAVASHWISTPPGFFLFVAAAWVFLAAVARCQAALNRSLLDPYRARESWEDRDWWNR